MKRIFKFMGMTVLPVLMLAGCDVREDLIEIQNDIDDLRLQIEQMNESISSLRTLLEEVKAGGIISSLQYQVEDQDTTGYVLSFQDGRTVTIHEGRDGHSPQLGVQQDENGTWCWTLDGEWLTDGEGNPFPAAARNGVDGVNGLTPQLKIIEDYWYLSTDEGETWTKLDKAKGEDAPSVFKSIDTSSSDSIILTLMDDSTVEIPVYRPLALTVDVEEGEHPLAPGETFDITYEVTGTDAEEAVVMAGSDGKFTLSMERGKASGVVHVTCPAEFTEGFVFLMANDGNGHSCIRVVNFYGRRIDIEEGWSFSVDGNENRLEIPLLYNFDYRLEVDEACTEWVHVEQTRAEMQEGKIILTVDANPAEEERTGTVRVCPSDSTGFVFNEITVLQAGVPQPAEDGTETES